jgi:SAM-dependent methyltransferase
MLAEEYFSKPMHALFRSYDLAAYGRVKLDVKRPALDLGCGNGAFASLVSRLYGLDGLDLATDLRPGDVRAASRRGLYRLAVPSDARFLPLKAQTIGFILCNGVLCCIEPGHDQAIAELARVLKPNGQLVMTVPTPRFTTLLLPVRILRQLGLRSLAERYTRAVNRRHGHRTLQSREEWQKELERAGLSVEDHAHYFSRREAIWWSILAMRPFQFSAFLRYLPGFVQRIAIAVTETMVRSLPEGRPIPQQEAGYLLIVARKLAAPVEPVWRDGS